jgi:hypothetical protein
MAGVFLLGAVCTLVLGPNNKPEKNTKVISRSTLRTKSSGFVG